MTDFIFEFAKTVGSISGIFAATFLLWGIVQFMPQNTMSIRLGNVVIALYVLDLAWVTLGTVISQERN